MVKGVKEMKREKLNRVTKFIMIISTASLIVADLFFANVVNSHSSGLMSFGYTTNLMFLFMFTFPVVFFLLNTLSFIKECILYRAGECSKGKFNSISSSFVLMLLGIAFYIVGANMTSVVGIYLAMASIVFLLVSVILMFIYFNKR